MFFAGSESDKTIAKFKNYHYTKYEIDRQRLHYVDCLDRRDLERGLFFYVFQK